MKTKYDKIAKHIKRLNELMGIPLDSTYDDGHAITVTMLHELHRLERKQAEYAFTSNAVDAAVEGRTEEDF